MFRKRVPLDFEDEDAAGYYFDRDSDDEVEERVAARESMDEDSNDEDVDAEGPRARARRRPDADADADADADEDEEEFATLRPFLEARPKDEPFTHTYKRIMHSFNDPTQLVATKKVLASKVTQVLAAAECERVFSGAGFSAVRRWGTTRRPRRVKVLFRIY